MYFFREQIPDMLSDTHLSMCQTTAKPDFSTADRLFRDIMFLALKTIDWISFPTNRVERNN